MAKIQRKIWALLFCFLLLSAVFPLHAAAEEKRLVPGGELFGIRLDPGGLLISSVKEVQSESGAVSPGRDAGLLPGDLLKAANGSPLKTASDLSRLVAKGKPIELEGTRGETAFHVTLFPAKEKGGSYLAGIWVRQGASGIGTVTFFDPETGILCGLGHGILDSESCALFPAESGTVHPARIDSLVKGQKGAPGEVRGVLEKEITGRVLSNRKTGVSAAAEKMVEGEAIPVASKEEVAVGPAQLLWAPYGEKHAYEVQIEEICDPEGDSKNMIVCVTDPALLEITGGIVQGMSGSPLIQNGKLIGAVTHVLVHDPSRGYGIFLENMLSSL